MATKKRTADDYPQFYKTTLVEDTLNAGTMIPLETALTAKDHVGILVHQIQYHLDLEHIALLADEDDHVFCGFSNLYRQGVAPLYGSENGVIDCHDWAQHNFGVAASGFLFPPIIHTFPKPALMHPAAFWFWIHCVSILVVKPQVHVNMMYNFVDLDDHMYQELFQTVLLQNLV
jgi:hypothetical protein